MGVCPVFHLNILLLLNQCFAQAARAPPLPTELLKVEMKGAERQQLQLGCGCDATGAVWTPLDTVSPSPLCTLVQLCSSGTSLPVRCCVPAPQACLFLLSIFRRASFWNPSSSLCSPLKMKLPSRCLFGLLPSSRCSFFLEEP